MADLSITAANVRAEAGSQVNKGTAGATITAGQTIYEDAATGKMLLADADALASANCVGVALNSASDGQPVSYVTSGPYNPGGTVVVGMAYAVSATAGGTCPYADLASGDYPTFLGFGVTSSRINMRRLAGGVAKP